MKHSLAIMLLTLLCRDSIRDAAAADAAEQRRLWSAASASAEVSQIEVSWNSRLELLVDHKILKQLMNYPGHPDEFPVKQFVRYACRHPDIRAFQGNERIVTVMTKAPANLAAVTPQPGSVAKSAAKTTSRLEHIKDAQESAISNGRYYQGEIDGVSSASGKNSLLLVSTLEQLRGSSPERVIAWADFLDHSGYAYPSTPAQIGKRSYLAFSHWADANQTQIIDETENHFVCRDLVTNITHELTFSNPPALYDTWQSRDAQGRLILRRTASNWKVVDGTDIALPQNLVVDWFVWETNANYVSDVPCARTGYTLDTAALVDKDDSYFTLEYKKVGDYIADRTIPEAESLPAGRVQYRVPANAADLSRVIDEAKGVHPPASSKGNSTLLLVGLNCILFVGILVFMLRRKGA